MPPGEFESAIPEDKRLQTHALDRAVTIIGGFSPVLRRSSPAKCFEFFAIKLTNIKLALTADSFDVLLGQTLVRFLNNILIRTLYFLHIFV
jgi:hypothetical protein